jgi:glycosyltransferase 2 family protein
VARCVAHSVLGVADAGTDALAPGVVPAEPVVVDLPRSDHVREASDVLRLVVALVVALPALLLAALGSDTIAGVQADLVRAFGRLPAPLRTSLVGIAQLVAVAAPAVLLAVLVVQRQVRLVVMLAAAAGVAALVTVGLDHGVIGDAQPQVWARIVEQESWLAERAFPTSSQLAGATAVVVVAGAFTRRGWRQALWVGLVAAALARVVSGANLPVDLVVALCVGAAAGSATLLVTGTPDRAPAGRQVATALRALGLRPRRVEEQRVAGDRSRRYRVEVADGPPLVAKVHDGDARDRDLLYRLWRFVRLRASAYDQLVTTVKAEAEREALVALWLHQAGADVPRPVAVGPVDRSAALVARLLVEGHELAGLDAGDVDDAVLDGVWRVLAQLRAARVAHRSFDLDAFVVDGDGDAWLVRVAGAELGADDELLDLDVAHLLVALASRVGATRAVAAARRVLGDPVVAASLPYVQVLGLPLALRLRLRGHEGVVSEVRDAVAEATGAEPSELARLQRVRPATLLVIGGALLALMVLLPQLTSLEAAVRALGDADYRWVAAAVLAFPVLYVGPTVSLLGMLGRRVPFGETYLAQVAAAFLNRVTPNGVGGLGLNLRFLQRAGLDTTTAGGALAVNSAAGGIANVILLAVFLIWAGQGDQAPFELPDRSLLLAAFAVVLAVVGIATLVPAARRVVGTRLGDLARRTTRELRAVMASPLRLGMVLGGALAGPLAQILVLGLALEALGGDVGIATLGAVYVGGHAIGSAAPTPGGLGGVEAALIAGLTGVDVDPAVATSTVLVFRLITFWLVIPLGWLAMRRLRRQGEL